jgi:transcriptional regulator of met regulon
VVAGMKDIHGVKGERGDFRKVTVTLPPKTYKALMEEVVRRKVEGEDGHLLSAVVREAVDCYLKAGEEYQKMKPELLRMLKEHPEVTVATLGTANGKRKSHKHTPEVTKK